MRNKVPKAIFCLASQAFILLMLYAVSRHEFRYAAWTRERLDVPLITSLYRQHFSPTVLVVFIICIAAASLQIVLKEGDARSEWFRAIASFLLTVTVVFGVVAIYLCNQSFIE